MPASRSGCLILASSSALPPVFSKALTHASSVFCASRLAADDAFADGYGFEAA